MYQSKADCLKNASIFNGSMINLNLYSQVLASLQCPCDSSSLSVPQPSIPSSTFQS